MRFALIAPAILLIAANAAVYADDKPVPFDPGKIEPGTWVEVGKSGGSVASATVYSPTRKQVLGFGGFKSDNEVRALDMPTGKWSDDYQATVSSRNLGGNHYGGQVHAGWDAQSNRPGAFFLFRNACWDSKRERMVIQALNLTAAYDPAKKEWTKLPAAYQSADGKRTEGSAPAGWQKPWFAPVPVQWSSMCYDPVNDEIVLFAHWATRHASGPDLPESAGVRAGHYGTFLFNCQTNTWTTPQLGDPETLEQREAVAEVINAQRESCRDGWTALISQRQGDKDRSAQWLAKAVKSQQEVIVAAKGMALKLPAIRPAIAVLDAAAAALKDGDLPRACSLQRAAYRKLRLIRRHDLPVQPVPRCSAGIVYDAKNKVIVLAGGNHLDRYLTDTWIYDCRMRRWREGAATPAPANWPGMCYDSKRGRVVYTAGKETYAYDSAADNWFKIGPAPVQGYNDMAYDPQHDLLVYNVSRNKYGADETTFVMRPTEGEAVETRAAAIPDIDDAPFPPPADPAALKRLAEMPANTWVRANPDREPTHRSWSTMSWDDGLRCVIYQGGGHAGTMDNSVSAYFPESNRWVDSFSPDRPPPLFANWSDAGGFPAFDRGVGLASHCRWYESHAGRMVWGSNANFEWATRERAIAADGRIVAADLGAPIGRRALDPVNMRMAGPAPGGYASNPIVASTVYVTDLKTGERTAHKLQGAVPTVNTEWSALAIHPDRNLLVLHGAGDSRKQQGNETWVLDLDDPGQWKQLDLKSTTPTVGMAKLSAIPGTPYLVCAMPASNDLWVLDLDRNAWKPLPADDGDDKLGKHTRFDKYGQCVWDPHHKVFVLMGLRGGYESRRTLLLRPDFSKIQW